MADVSAIIQKAIRLYRDKIASVKVKGRGLSAYNKFSEEAGNVCVDVLHSIENDVSGQDELRQVMRALFRENHDTVNQKTAAAIQKLSGEAGVGLKARRSPYDPSAANAIARNISGRDSIREGIDASKNDILLQSQKTADRTMQMNAEFQSRAGMQVLVSREYDNVGVHTTDKGGGETCQWCLSRCGSDVPYQEAYARGMFERHPGCGCVITYKSAKGTYTQGKGQWESNSWKSENAILREKRIDYSNLQQHKKGDKVMITDQAIDKVTRIAPSNYTESELDEIQDMHRNLLKYSRESNMSNEVGMAYQVGNVVSNPVKGSQSFIDLESDADMYHLLYSSEQRSILLAHNHPGLSYFSYADIGMFVQYPSIGTMTVVTNQGKVWYIQKKENYDDLKALGTYREILSSVQDVEELGEDAVDSFFLKMHNQIERGRK